MKVLSLWFHKIANNFFVILIFVQVFLIMIMIHRFSNKYKVSVYMKI